MKRPHYFFTLLFVGALLSSTGCIPGFQQSDSMNNLIDSKGRPTADLLSLLAQTNIVHDGTLKGIVAATQKVQPEGWIRAPGKERWEIDELFPEQRKEIFVQFDRMNMLEAISPKSMQYDYVILPGATISRVRARLAFLLDLWHHGVRFDQIIVLGGKRPLDANLESEQIMFAPTTSDTTLSLKENWHPAQMPTTELEMMEMVYNQTQLPEAFARIPILFVDSPMKQKADGTWTRPSRQDTIESWLALNPKPGSVLIISNQPFIGYDDTVFRSFVPDPFCVQVVGPKAGQSVLTAVILDSLARTLYTELSRIQKQQ
jgi:hypothetical protein